jgi:ankyrin repeat protein
MMGIHNTSIEDASPFFYKETALAVVFIILPLNSLSVLIALLLNGLEDAHIVILMQFKTFTSTLIALLITQPICYLFLRLLLILRRQHLTLPDGVIYFLVLLMQGVLLFLLSFRLYSRVSTVIDRISNIIADKRAKLKYKELVNICCNLLEGGSSLEDVERWLNENQDNYRLLRQAANYRDEIDLYDYHEKNSTPLHYLVCAHPPFQLVQRILQLAPNTIEKKNKWGYLPLHNALRYNASPEVIKMLFETYPHAAKVQSKEGKLPLHLAKCDANAEIIKMLLDAYPYGARLQDDFGHLPLHFVCCSNASLEVISLLIEAYPQAAEVQNKHGLPLHAACTSNVSLEVIKLLIEAYPRAIEVKDKRGHLPLDYVNPKLLLALRPSLSRESYNLYIQARSAPVV